MSIVIQNKVLTQTIKVGDTVVMIIIALGNPGEKYHTTRHNAGWLVVDEFVDDWTINKYANSLEKKVDDLVYVKPETFMNNSGQSLGWYLKEYGVHDDGEKIVVIHDDIDLPLGSVRICFDRGDAGHNGVRSIMSHFGSQAFVRIRIGVLQISKDLSTPEFVLEKFSQEELKVIKALAPKVKAIVETIQKDGHEKAMNVFN